MAFSEIRSTLQEPVTIAFDGGNQQLAKSPLGRVKLRIEVSAEAPRNSHFPLTKCGIRFPGAEYKRFPRVEKRSRTRRGCARSIELINNKVPTSAY